MAGFEVTQQSCLVTEEGEDLGLGWAVKAEV